MNYRYSVWNVSMEMRLFLGQLKLATRIYQFVFRRILTINFLFCSLTCQVIHEPDILSSTKQASFFPYPIPTISGCIS